MARIFGGHLVAKYIREIENLETVFTISGGHIENILDGFSQYGIRTIDVRHEQAAAMMAHAWSIYSGETGVCLVTAGPGFTNALTGIANACLDSAPLVVLCGRHPLRDDLTGALQEMNQIDMVKPVTKWAATCYETKRIPEYLSLAFQHATLGRPGPVFLELPPDILFVSVDEDSVTVPRRGDHKTVVLPAESKIRVAAKLINEAKKPLLIGGSGVGFSDCGSSLGEFIDQTGVPFALMNNGRGVLPDDHSRCINDGGFIGVGTGLPQADLVIAVGIRFNWVLQSGTLFPDAKVVRIDIEPREIDRNRTVDVGLVGDVDEVLKRLIPQVEKRNHEEWAEKLRNAYSAFRVTEMEQRSTPAHPIHPNRLAAKIQEFFGTEAYYVSDGGDTSYFALAGFMSSQKAGVITPAGSLLGCLGTGIPFALAAKLAHPDNPVVVLHGDGSFGFNGMEFDTAVRHDIPIICVINNDCAWGMIKHSQEMSIGPERVTCAELGIRRYDKMVEGLGGYGELVERDEDIIPALQRAVDSGKPACVNVLTDQTVTSPATVIFYQNLSNF
jgi:thiamine pyrophosphate-dependent acetolactate synthase large subunit-like protein